MARQAIKAADVPSFAGTRDRLRQMAVVASQLGGIGWASATDVLHAVRAVQTRFIQIDFAARVGGWPIERVAVLHGPSNEGKTEFALGLGASFLERGHFFALIDAEYTTPAPWLRTIMGGYDKHPGFRALRPTNYEEAIDLVRKFCTTIAEAKLKGNLQPDTSGLIVVDSIQRLQPKRLLDAILKEGAEESVEDTGKKGRFGKKKKGAGADGMRGRGGMYKAAVTGAWLGELVPLLAKSGCAALIITRETVEIETSSFVKQIITIGGGKDLVFDASILARIQRVGWVAEKDSTVYGERHMVEIRKTKIGPKEAKHPVGYYHTSNGVLVPEGFDRARDVLEMAIDHGLVAVGGAGHYSWGKVKLGQGEHNVVRKLYDDPERLDTLELEVREAFKPNLVGKEV
jgi:recombination protein RecA